MNYPVRNAQQAEYLGRIQGWIKAKNTEECLRFAEEIGQSKDADGLPALMELLKLPSGFWQRRPSAAMCAAREAAVHAIAQIDSSDALSCLGIALFNPCPGVRAAASHLLNQAGAKTIDPLARMMSWKQNWSVEGMRVLLYTLGGLRNSHAGPPLARVILGELPVAPPRWKNQALSLAVPAIIIEASILFWLFFSVIGTGLGSVSLLFGLTILFAVLDVIMVVSTRNTTMRAERTSLAVAGCEALRILGDKRALGTLLFHSRRSEPEVAAAAYAGVLALLPLLDAHDTEWMPMADRHRLEGMLGLPDPNMVMAVLQAMEFVGTGQGEHRIRQLITKGATDAIRREAARVFPIVAERARLEKVSGTLLRASQSPTHAQDELLRAANAANETPQEQLLRPTLGQGGE